MQLPHTSFAPRIVLSTPRLALRPYTHDAAFDFWQLLQQNRDRLISDFPDRTNAVGSLQDAEHRIRIYATQHRSGDLFSFGIWRKEDDEYLGDITLRRLARGKPHAEVGYYLDEGVQGHGYATEALKEVARYAFQELRMESINLRCAEGNDRSRKVAERCGFTHTKVFTPAVNRAPGPNRPIHVYQLKRNDPAISDLWKD